MKPIVPALISSSHKSDGRTQRPAEQLAARQALDLLAAEGLDGLLREGPGLVGGFDGVVAHVVCPDASGHNAKCSPSELFSKKGRYGMTNE